MIAMDILVFDLNLLLVRFYPIYKNLGKFSLFIFCKVRH